VIDRDYKSRPTLQIPTNITNDDRQESRRISWIVL
jgi:hypothetical protein